MDKYRDFSSLALAEGAGAYWIVATPRGTRYAIIAPHGGAIEPGTSEVARAIAGSELSLYLFEGGKTAGNSALHITSTRFDEPQGRAVARASEIVLTIHGEASVDEAVTYIGGADFKLRNVLADHLENEGFKTRKHSNPELDGIHPDNICNAGRLAAGIQLELSHALRLEFFPSLTPKGRAAPRVRFHQFVRSIRQFLDLA